MGGTEAREEKHWATHMVSRGDQRDGGGGFPGRRGAEAAAVAAAAAPGIVGGGTGEGWRIKKHNEGVVRGMEEDEGLRGVPGIPPDNLGVFFWRCVRFWYYKQKN